MHLILNLLWVLGSIESWYLLSIKYCSLHSIFWNCSLLFLKTNSHTTVSHLGFFGHNRKRFVSDAYEKVSCPVLYFPQKYLAVESNAFSSWFSWWIFYLKVLFTLSIRSLNINKNEFLYWLELQVLLKYWLSHMEDSFMVIDDICSFSQREYLWLFRHFSILGTLVNWYYGVSVLCQLCPHEKNIVGHKIVLLFYKSWIFPFPDFTTWPPSVMQLWIQSTHW